MENRLTPADSARMLHGIAQEKEVLALIDLVLDQSLPRDVRRHAGDKLNDLEAATLEHIRTHADKATLGKLQRCGFVQAKYQAFAKGACEKPEPVKEQTSETMEEKIARLERENGTLRETVKKKSNGYSAGTIEQQQEALRLIPINRNRREIVEIW